MNVGMLRDRIADLPDDYNVELQTMICMMTRKETEKLLKDNPDNNVDLTKDAPYQLRYHEPIIGLAIDDKNKEIVFVMRDPNLDNDNIEFFEKMLDG